MAAITAYTALTPAQDLQPALFADFVAFIDRTEKTARTYITNLKQFAAWLNFSEITRPVRADIINYRAYLTSEHDAIQYDAAEGWTYRTDRSGNRQRITCAANTIAAYLRSVCAFFKWTAANGVYPDIAAGIHAPKIRHDSHKKEALTASDVVTIENSIRERAADKIAEAAMKEKDTAGRIIRATEQGKRDFAMYLLAVTAGLRTVELSRLRVKDLQTKNGNAVIWIHGKGHSEADTRKAIAPEVFDAIRDYMESRTDRPTAASPLFAATGNRSGGKAIAATTISKILKKQMQQAGYNSERLTAHSLRHTAGTNAYSITGNLYDVQQYMRHANPATTEIYMHVDSEQQDAETARRLYDHYHGITDQSGDDLQHLLQSMSAEQITQLTAIAKAMSR